MSCPGLHCAGCAGGAAVPVVPLLAFCGLAWVAEHIVEVAIVCGVSGVLAVAAVVALLRWGERRDARQRACATIWTVRPDARPSRGEPAGLYPAQASAGLPSQQRPAIAPPQTIISGGTHIWLTGLPDEGQAAAIRKAISGTAGDAITEGK